MKLKYTAAQFEEKRKEFESLKADMRANEGRMFMAGLNFVFGCHESVLILDQSEKNTLAVLDQENAAKLVAYLIAAFPNIGPMQLNIGVDPSA